MKVLTKKTIIYSLIAEGLKEYEFRAWKMKYRGEFLIPANGKSSFGSMNKTISEKFYGIKRLV